MVGRDSDTVVPAVLPARQSGSHSALQFARRCCEGAKPAQLSAPHRIAAPEPLSSLFDLNGRSTVTVVPIAGMRDDLEHAAVRAHAFPHADHAQVTLRGGGLDRAADVEPAAVVLDRQRDARRRRCTMRTLTRRADAWRRALVIDSCATRKQAISSSDGSRPSRCSGVFSVPSSSSIATPDSAGLRFQVCAQRGDQADLVEQRRPQIDRHLAHAGDQIVDQRDRVRDAVGRRPAGARAQLQPQLERGQRLPQLVVQLVGEEPTLVLLRRLEAPIAAARAARRRPAACPAPRWRRARSPRRGG